MRRPVLLPTMLSNALEVWRPEYLNKGGIYRHFIGS